MAEDIAPALLEKIRADFTHRLGGRQRATELLELIEGGTGTYQTANDYRGFPRQPEQRRAAGWPHVLQHCRQGYPPATGG